LISISFWTLSSVSFTISLLTIHNSNRWECTERNIYQYRSARNI
jgi:hypothetical protein